jgi:adenylate cyclase
MRPDETRSTMDPRKGGEARLESWKDIAAYLKRSVSTVQRWEKQEGLPVHRLQHSKLGTLYAYPSELDAWFNLSGGPVPATGRGTASPSRPRSILVLPFGNMSREPDTDYFADGLTEELITDLSQVEGLRVISSTSAMQLKGTHEDVTAIARRLNVQYILEGTVRRAGTDLRITAQLIDGSNDSHLWAEKYVGTLEDVFEIQEKLSRRIVEELKVTLTSERPLQKAPTVNVRAYDFYLRGRSFFYQARRDRLEVARQMFSRAIEEDPGFARAYSGLADTCSWLYRWHGQREADLEDAVRASRKALELDPDLAEAHAAHGFALCLFERYSEADVEFEAAIRLDPKLFEAYYFYARSASAQGRLEEAARLYEKASEVRPEDYQTPLLLAMIYGGLERGDKALEAYRRGLDVACKHLEVSPNDARALYLGAGALIRLGERERGLEWARRALEIEPDGGFTLYNVGCAYVHAGEIEQALDCLEKATDAGGVYRLWLAQDPDLRPLHDVPRFRALLERLE